MYGCSDTARDEAYLSAPGAEIAEKGTFRQVDQKAEQPNDTDREDGLDKKG